MAGRRGGQQPSKTTVSTLSVCVNQSIHQSINARFVGRCYTTSPLAGTNSSQL